MRDRGPERLDPAPRAAPPRGAGNSTDAALHALVRLLARMAVDELESGGAPDTQTRRAP